MRIGFVGTGLMGSRMAAHLVSPEHELFVYNRTRSKTAGLEAQGATVCESPADVASRVEVLFSMLSDPDAVQAAALGTDGFLDALPGGRDLGRLQYGPSGVLPSYGGRCN